MDSWYQKYTDYLKDLPELNDIWFDSALAAAKEGDAEARQRILAASLRLVLDVASELECGSAVPLHELIEIGNSVLDDALDEFKLTGSASYRRHVRALVRTRLLEESRRPDDSGQ